MSLERYRLDRIVVQNQESSVYSAVRAMESNHVGLVHAQLAEPAALKPISEGELAHLRGQLPKGLRELL